MEGAVLSGKLAAEVICDKATGRSTNGVREVDFTVGKGEEKAPVGVRGNFPIAFGGGQQETGPKSTHP